MNGVTILNEFEVTQVVNDTFNCGAAGLTMLIVVAVCATTGFLIGRRDFASFEGAVLGILIGLVFSLPVSLVSGCAFAHEPITETTIYYEVTVGDEVSMNEFNNKYEIIEQRGNIFTVKERTSDD